MMRKCPLEVQLGSSDDPNIQSDIMMIVDRFPTVDLYYNPVCSYDCVFTNTGEREYCFLGGQGHWGEGGDRKSTRLNSSHL